MKTNTLIILAYFAISLITIIFPLASLADITPVVSNVQVRQQHGGAKVKF